MEHNGEALRDTCFGASLGEGMEAVESKGTEGHTIR